MGKFGLKESKLFLLPKIGTRGILEELILNVDLDFWSSDLKIHFWTNLARKNWNCLFWLKIGTHGILEEFIPNPESYFQNSDLKIHFWANLDRKSIPCLFLFETLLLFLEIWLVLVLYFNIALHSSAAFYGCF